MNPAKKPSFIDLCAGCGGLSLGLVNAGWHGVFAAEKNNDAFSTLSFNLLGNKSHAFTWPEWLSQAPHSLEELTEKYSAKLKSLRGQIDLLAGGPPCQGFSTFGRRLAHDPRNQVFREYIKLVQIVKPKMVLMENVRGILSPFKGEDAPKDEAGNALVYSEVIKEALSGDYQVSSAIIQAKDFGVPQIRPRFILIGVHKNYISFNAEKFDPFLLLAARKERFLSEKHLESTCTTVAEAISDLRAGGTNLSSSLDNPKFKQGHYGKQTSNYQRLMHGNLNGCLADSHRFAKHKESTIEKFRWFQENCSVGKIIPTSERGIHANKKRTIYVLHPNRPAPTITTLPDDIIHYDEPRILTVREMARLQSFPDSFEFKGKYTTGGSMRVKECPRYTQVGNAVPPLLAEAIGRVLLELISSDILLKK